MKNNRFVQICFATLLITVMVLSGLQVPGVAAQTTVNNAPSAPTKSADLYQLDLNIGTNPVTLDPSLATNANSFDVIEQMFIGLVDLEDSTAAVQPELATNWVFSNNNTIIDFTLRTDVFWSDGHTVTAEDVKYGILRALDPATQSDYAYVLFPIFNAQNYHDGVISNPDLVGVTALTATHLRITLSAPAAAFLSVLSLPVARPLPSWAITSWGDQWAQVGHIVTNGAYRLAEWVADDHILLEKNPTYFNAVNVHIEKVNLVMVDSATAITMYANAELDSVDLPPFTPTDAILQQEIVREPNACTYYYGINSAMPPFDNLLVRKAFIAATDRRAVTSAMGSGFPALTFTPPGVFGYVDGVAEGVGIPYNPTQARAWMAEAGYPNGQGLPPITLWFNTSIGHQNIAQIVHDSWLEVLGVNVTLNTLDWSPYLSELNNGDYQIWRLGWCGDYADAHNFLYDGIFSRTKAFGDWDNSTYWNYLSQASLSVDSTTRKNLFKLAEEILVETDAVMLPIYHYEITAATKPYLLRTYGTVPADYANWIMAFVTQTIPTSSGGTLTSTDGQVHIQVDPGDFPEDVTLTQAPATGMPPSGNLAGAGQVFEITAQNSVGDPLEMASGQSVTLQVSYTDEEVLTIVEDSLAMYFWDGNAWVKDNSSVVDMLNNTVTATPGHFSTWALLGDTNRIFIPLVIR